jgi:hypothetical protein
MGAKFEDDDEKENEDENEDDGPLPWITPPNGRTEAPLFGSGLRDTVDTEACGGTGYRCSRFRIMAAVAKASKHQKRPR